MGLDGIFLKQVGMFRWLGQILPLFLGPILSPYFPPILVALLFFVIGLGFEPNMFSLGLVLRRFSFSKKFLAKIHKKKNKKNVCLTNCILLVF